MDYIELLDEALLEKEYSKKSKEAIMDLLDLAFEEECMKFIDLVFYIHDEKKLKTESYKKTSGESVKRRLLAECESKNGTIRDFERKGKRELVISINLDEMSYITFYPDYNQHEIMVEVLDYMDKKTLYTLENFINYFIKFVTENFN